jgi:hypothetical protein
MDGAVPSGRGVFEDDDEDFGLEPAHSMHEFVGISFQRIALKYVLLVPVCETLS